MKNILILCDAFPPSFNPRMGYLCKYLPQLGWNPVIVTEYTSEQIYTDLAENQDVVYINYYHSKNKILQRIKYLFVFLADLLFGYKNLIIRKKAELVLKNQPISLILSSSFRVYPTLAAQQLSEKYHIPFVMDLRDIFEQSGNNELISKRCTNVVWLNKLIASVITKKLVCQRNRILKKANAVTTVSQWHVETLSKFNSNTNLIFNGFDPELFYPEKIENKQFVVVYTGRLHSKELRNPSLLFEAVAQLSASKKINPVDFRLQFYLMDKVSKDIIIQTAASFAVLEYLDCFDTVPSKEIPKILNRSSVLLVLTNSSKGENAPKGIMGTKIFEYLAVEKPILCVQNDEGCLEETIIQSNAGLSTSSVSETVDFLLEKYEEWLKNKYIMQSLNRDYIQQYSRKAQAKQFVTLFERLL